MGNTTSTGGSSPGKENPQKPTPPENSSGFDSEKKENFEEKANLNMESQNLFNETFSAQKNERKSTNNEESSDFFQNLKENYKEKTRNFREASEEKLRDFKEKINVKQEDTKRDYPTLSKSQDQINNDPSENTRSDADAEITSKHTINTMRQVVTELAKEVTNRKPTPVNSPKLIVKSTIKATFKTGEEMKSQSPIPGTRFTPNKS